MDESNRDMLDIGHQEHTWNRKYLLDLRNALASLGDNSDNDEMPKVGDAHSVQMFALDKDFQATFDQWKAGVEQQMGGTLVITHEEVVADCNNKSLLIFWNVQPRNVVASRRR